MIEYLPLVLTGLGLTASIFYYTMTLKNANKTRQAQLLANIYNQMDTPEKAKALNSVFKMKFKDFNELVTNYIDNPDQETWNHVLQLVIQTEGQGSFVREGFIEIEKVALLLGGFIVYFWGLFEPYKDEIRSYLGYPRWASETEYLYNRILDYKETHPSYQI